MFIRKLILVKFITNKFSSLALLSYHAYFKIDFGQIYNKYSSPTSLELLCYLRILQISWST